MPGPRIPVVVFGPELPPQGQQWFAYKNAAMELVFNRTQRQRHEDRQTLKAGGELSINGYIIRKSLSPPSILPNHNGQ